jgi:hypothetical protein
MRILLAVDTVATTEMLMNAVAARTKGQYGISGLHGIESGRFLPRMQKLPVLLKAYGVKFDDVSKPLRS